MIVLVEGDGRLTLARQMDHARVSAAIASAWKRPAALPPELWERFRQVVETHDQGWIALENQPPLNHATGRPHDFLTLPTSQHITVWRRGIEQACQGGNIYAALLIAQLARCLYTQFARETDPADQRQAQLFINETTLLIDRHIDALHQRDGLDRLAVQPQILQITSRLLQSFDAMSLCLLGAIVWSNPSPPLAFGQQCQPMTFQRRDGRGYEFSLDPWPFEAEELELTMPAQRTHSKRFLDSGEISKAWAVAEPVERRWKLVPGE